MNKDFNIEEFLSLEGYATDERQERRKGSGGSNEYYTINLNDLQTKLSFQISETRHFTWSKYPQYKDPLLNDSKLDKEYYDKLVNSSLF